MKFLAGLSKGPVVSCALLLGLLAQDVVAAPQPKSDWVQNAKSRKKMTDILNGKIRRDLNTTLCSESAARTVSAPKQNVWGGLTDEEAASVVSWLFAQPDLNLTVSENATEWDNTM